MINNLADIKDFEHKPKNVLVKLGAPWCAPCRTLENVLKEVARESSIAMLNVNLDEFPQIATKFGVVSIPTILLFIDGEPVWRSTGIQNKETILNEIKKGERIK